MQRTFSMLLAPQCRSRTFHLVADVFPVEKFALIDYESCHRRLHCLLNAGSLARQNSESRSYSETKDAVKDVSQWWIDYKKRKSYKERCISRIATSLECSEDQSRYLIDRDPLTFLDKTDKALKTIEYLKEQGISANCIRKNAQVVRVSDSELQLRMKCVKTWEIDEEYVSEFIPILRLPMSEFIPISNTLAKEKQKNIPDGNRIIHFAKLLGCPAVHVCRAFIKSRGLFRANFDDIKSSIQCYLDFGVQPDLILKDIPAVRARVVTIKRRLSGPFKDGIQPLRPSLVTCSEFTYRRKLKELREKKNEFGTYKNAEEYLTDKLFSKKHHISAHKQTKLFQFFATLDPKDLMDKIEFLLERNYTVDQICSNLMIFGLDIRIVEERYNRLIELGVQSPTLSAMTRKPFEFEDFAKRAEYNTRESKEILDELTLLVARPKR